MHLVSVTFRSAPWACLHLLKVLNISSPEGPTDMTKSIKQVWLQVWQNQQQLQRYAKITRSFCFVLRGTADNVNMSQDMLHRTKPIQSTTRYCKCHSVAMVANGTSKLRTKADRRPPTGLQDFLAISCLQLLPWAHRNVHIRCLGHLSESCTFANARSEALTCLSDAGVSAIVVSASCPLVLLKPLCSLLNRCFPA